MKRFFTTCLIFTFITISFSQDHFLRAYRFGTNAIAVDDTSVLIVGSTIDYFTSPYDIDLQLSLVNAIGDTLWQKEIDFPDNDPPYLGFWEDNTLLLYKGSGNSLKVYYLDENYEITSSITKTLKNTSSISEHTSDNGYLMLYNDYPQNFLDDHYIQLMKLDENFDSLWSLNINESPWFEKSWRIMESSSNEYIAVGMSMDAPGDSSLGTFTKIDANGNIVMSKKINTSDYSCQLTDIQQLDNGNFLIGGTNVRKTGKKEAFIIETDQSANILNQTTFDYDTLINLDNFHKMDDNGWLIFCKTQQAPDFNYSDILVIRTDNNLDTLWTKTIGNSGEDYLHIINPGAENGDIILAGRSVFRKNNYSSSNFTIAWLDENLNGQPYQEMIFGEGDYCASDSAFKNDSVFLFSSLNNCIEIHWNNGYDTVFTYATQTGEYHFQYDLLGYTGYSDTLTLVEHLSPEFDLGNDTTICGGSELMLDAGQGNYEYLWNLDSTSQTITISASDTLSVKVTNEHGCFSTDTIKIIFSETPTTSEILGNTTPDKEVIELYSVLETSNSTYLWLSDSGIISNGQGENQVSLSWTNDGFYDTLWVIETNEYGCQGEPIKLALTVGEIPVDTTTNDTTSIDPTWITNEKTEVMVYPIPSSGQITVALDQLPSNTILSISDLKGRQQIQTALDTSSKEIDLSALNKGMYVLRIQSQNKIIFNQLLILE